MIVSLKIKYDREASVGTEVDRYYEFLQTICEKFPGSKWGRGKKGELLVGL